MLLTDSTAVARQVTTLIRPKSSTRKTAGLDLASGPQHLQGTVEHVVKSNLAQAVAYRLGTSLSHGIFLHVNSVFWFAHGSPMVYMEPL
jgi:hypothetical protein